SNMRDPCNSTRNMAENSSTADNTQNTNTLDSHNNRPGILLSQLPQFLEFRRKPARQNSAQEQKPVHLPPIQLREAFSWIFPCCLSFLRGMEAPAEDFLGAPLCVDRLQRPRWTSSWPAQTRSLSTLTLLDDGG